MEVYAYCLLQPPTTGAFSIPALAVVLAALMAAYSDIIVRQISQRTTPLTVTLCYLVIGALITSLTLPFSWQTPIAAQWVALLCVGMFSSIFQILLTKGLKKLPTSAIAPCDYSTIAWALIFDAAIWDILPKFIGIVGTAFIILDGLLAYYTSRPNSKGGTRKNNNKEEKLGRVVILAI